MQKVPFHSSESSMWRLQIQQPKMFRLEYSPSRYLPPFSKPDVVNRGASHLALRHFPYQTRLEISPIRGRSEERQGTLKVMTHWLCASTSAFYSPNLNYWVSVLFLCLLDKVPRLSSCLKADTEVVRSALRENTRAISRV